MKQGDITRAILLSAGLGTRLRPLTLTTPKPLLPLDGALLIDHQLRYLAKAGFCEVAINLHHLGEKIREHVEDGARFGVKVRYSEEPEILGTGGGIKKAAASFGSDHFVVLNADALMDADIRQVAKRHFDAKAAATMVVKELSGTDSYNPVSVDQGGMIDGFGKGRHFYTGLQILGPEMLAALPPAGEEACLVNDGYKKLMKDGQRIAAFVYRGYFNDLGTPERYEQAKRDAASGTFRVLI
ncbi:MAG: nucleotidyltransferase family protein [Pseudomonadota bacterium]